MKRYCPLIILVLANFAVGCHATKKATAPAPPAVTASHTIVTPDASLLARVISVNTIGRFVVLDFPDGQLPALDQTLFIYRSGLKVASVKITGPRQENNIVADLVSGETKVGDTVRDQ